MSLSKNRLSFFELNRVRLQLVSPKTALGFGITSTSPTFFEISKLNSVSIKVKKLVNRASFEASSTSSSVFKTNAKFKFILLFERNNFILSNSFGMFRSVGTTFLKFSPEISKNEKLKFWRLFS